VVAPTKSLDDTLDEIAALPKKISEDSRTYFRNIVDNAIGDAVPGIKARKPFSDKKIASELRAVKREADALLVRLRKMDSCASNLPGIAGRFLRAAAREQKLASKHFVDQLELLTKVAEGAASDIARRSKSSAAGRPPGTPGNLGFDFFVRQLLVDAQGVGVKLTIFKRRDGGFGGSLLNTIELLRAHLPDNFVPKASLGRRLDHIVHGH
jgi:hypothetical protein